VWIEESPEDGGCAVEWQVGHSLERLDRKRDSERVRSEHLDIWHPCPQLGRELRVDLDRDHPARVPRERGGQNAGTCPEVEDEVVALNLGSANQLRCELATAKEMLAGAAT
jgi:hypothetical protein